MRFLRHLVNLLREIGGFAYEYKAWWMVPLVLAFLLLGLLVAMTQGVAPFIYAIF